MHIAHPHPRSIARELTLSFYLFVGLCRSLGHSFSRAVDEMQRSNQSCHERPCPFASVQGACRGKLHQTGEAEKRAWTTLSVLEILSRQFAS
jgi:hypothetical protein